MNVSQFDGQAWTQEHRRQTAELELFKLLISIDNNKWTWEPEDSAQPGPGLFYDTLRRLHASTPLLDHSIQLEEAMSGALVSTTILQNNAGAPLSKLDSFHNRWKHSLPRVENRDQELEELATAMDAFLVSVARSQKDSDFIIR